jgi:hypothetical protein
MWLFKSLSALWNSYLSIALLAFELYGFLVQSERRKIERRIRRLEKQRRAALEHTGEDLEMQAGEISHQLAQLKEDLEYVRVSGKMMLMHEGVVFMVPSCYLIFFFWHLVKTLWEYYQI